MDLDLAHLVLHLDAALLDADGAPTFPFLVQHLNLCFKLLDLLQVANFHLAAFFVDFLAILNQELAESFLSFPIFNLHNLDLAFVALVDLINGSFVGSSVQLQFFTTYLEVRIKFLKVGRMLLRQSDVDLTFSLDGFYVDLELKVLFHVPPHGFKLSFLLVVLEVANPFLRVTEKMLNPLTSFQLILH